MSARACRTGWLLGIPLLVSILGADSADLALHEKLLRIDRRRKELREKMEQVRHQRPRNRMYCRIGLAEAHKDLMLLDYEDPRSRLGQALALQMTDRELVKLLYQSMLDRTPKEDELKRCTRHIAEHKEGRKEAIHEIVWALCNTKEFVDRIDLQVCDP